MKVTVVVLCAALIAPAAQATDPGCTLQPVHPVGSRIDSGALHLDLGSPDKPDHPTAWEGPIVINRQGRASCAVKDNVAIISPPLMLGNDRFLYVPTYSGSESIFYIVDTQDCSVRWQSQPYTGDAVFKQNTVYLHEAGHIHVGAQCLPDSPAGSS